MGVSAGTPPCGTEYDGYDRKEIKPQYRPTQGYTEAQGEGKPAKFSKETIRTTCHNLAKPFEMVNKLKVRHKDDLKVGDEEGASDEDVYLEGFAFTHYDDFVDGEYPKRPYPRLWDTGAEAGQTGAKPDYTSDYGGHVSIVGVGREGQRAKMSGSGSGSVNPITSLAELKQYQANCLHKFGLNCLCRFDQTFKMGMGADPLLYQSGAEVPIQDSNGLWKNVPIPAAFRGAIGAPDLPDGTKTGFPCEGRDSCGPDATGMDNVKVGDIVCDEKGFSSDGNGLPKACGKVKQINEGGEAGDFVKLVIFNRGTNPDIAGVTDKWGIGTGVIMYKGAVPADDLRKKMDKSGPNKGLASSDCGNLSIERCNYKNWKNAEIYRLEEHVIDGSD